jgi:thiamine kinase-like enzyme
VAKRFTVEILQSDLLNHRAVQAWNQLQHRCVEPDRIVVLQSDKKSEIYRLEDKATPSLIAKRCRRASALLERTVYEDILQDLAIPGLNYHGFLPEEDGNHCWLFLDEAIGEEYSPQNELHRMAAGRWLAALHGHTAKSVVARSLPSKDSSFYLRELRSARETILQNSGNPLLTSDDLIILDTVVSQLDLLERRWEQVTEFCDRMPNVLVHGDLVAKNVRVGSPGHGNHLLVMDWEMAGWGVPAVDLAQLGGRVSISPDLGIYYSLVKSSWPNLELVDVQRLGQLGGMFRLITAIHWATRDLPTHWVEDAMEGLRAYTTRFAPLLESEDLSNAPRIWC